MSKVGEYVRLSLATLLVPAACGGLVFALVRWRPALEPIVRWVDWWVMSGRTHAAYAYDPRHYWVYVAIAAVWALIGILAGVWALAEKPASDRRLERYLGRQIEGQAKDHHRSL